MGNNRNLIINPNHIDLSSKPIVSFDLETTGLQAWEEKIDLIALKIGPTVYVLEVDKYPHQYLKELFMGLSQCEKLIAHNAKFDASFIYCHFGILLTNLHCTEMAAEICENGNQKRLREQYQAKKYGFTPFSLVGVLKRWLNIQHKDTETKKIWQKSFISKKADLYRKTPVIRKKQIEYAAEDVMYLEQLYSMQMARIEELGLHTIYRLEHKLLPVLVKMETTGCLIDALPWGNLVDNVWKPEYDRIEAALDNEVLKLLNGATFHYHVNRRKQTVEQFDLFGASNIEVLEDPMLFNYGSTDQVQEFILFLNEKMPVNDAGDPSLEEDPLMVYITENPGTKLTHFIVLLLEHRKISKLVSTYGYKFLSKLDKNSYIHTLYTQTKTETGRLSSKSPNLQNIPAAPKNDPNKDIRRFFIAAPGKVLITCDMSGAEVAIAADYSGEPLLLNSLLNGVDMHSELASVSYSIIFDRETVVSKSTQPFVIDSIEYIPGELRDDHKSVVFAKFYKGGAARVYGVLSVYINKHCSADKRKEVAQRISEALDAKMPVLSDYLSDLITQAKSQGYLRTSSFGRIRFFDQNVYGEAANAPFQGTNAEAIKMAMVNLDKLFSDNEHWGARLVMNIHDEVVCECNEEFAEIVAEKVKETMAQSLSYFLTKLKGGASVSISKHWKK